MPKTGIREVLILVFVDFLMNNDDGHTWPRYHHRVLILVFVDFLMNIEDYVVYERLVKCLNPCFRGLSHEYDSKD